MKIKLESYRKNTQDCLIEGTESFKIYNRMIGQYETRGVNGKPPLFCSSIDGVREIASEFVEKYKQYNPKCLSADDPGLMTFGFAMYFEDSDGKESACFVRIPLSIVRREFAGGLSETALTDFCNSVFEIFNNR